MNQNPWVKRLIEIVDTYGHLYDRRASDGLTPQGRAIFDKLVVFACELDEATMEAADKDTLYGVVIAYREYLKLGYKAALHFVRACELIRERYEEVPLVHRKVAYGDVVPFVGAHNNIAVVCGFESDDRARFVYQTEDGRFLTETIGGGAYPATPEEIGAWNCTCGVIKVGS